LTTEKGFRRYYADDLNRMREFLRDRRPALFAAVAVFLVVIAASFKVRKRASSLIEDGVIDARHVHLITRPFPLGLLLGLLVMFPLLPVAPAPVRGILNLLFVIPILRLLVPLMRPVYRPLLYATLAISVLFQACKLIPASPTFKRILLAFIMLIAIVLAEWLLHRAYREEGRLPSVFFRIYIGLALALMLASLIANLAGLFALSLVLGDGALLSSCYAIIFYTAQRVIYEVGSVLLRTHRAQKLSIVREYRPVITNWLRAVLLFTAIVGWVLGTLNLFTVRDRVLNSIGDVLASPIQMGKVAFTIGGVLTFLLIIVIGIVCANIARVLLREDVLKRLPLQHGIPYALSTVTYYLLLLGIFLVALAGSGVELSKFTILTGAFGVGVGFGLQNVVNNFASGLILLFERPIRVHDTLEVEGHSGEVTRIGMRSTSIRTIDGAEVILPNSSLVAGKVINWSRLAMRRRVELQVHVAYGTDPRFVLDLLKETAAAHPDVLTDPEPAAFFNAFGETAQQFALVFWAPHFQLAYQLRTDVAVAVITALKEAGIEVPFPQRDLHVKSVDPSVHEFWEARSASATGSPVSRRPPDGNYKADS
jgi:small-conductance mechanosensitive channel